MAAQAGRIITVTSGAHAGDTAGGWVLSAITTTEGRLCLIQTGEHYVHLRVGTTPRTDAVVCAAVDPGGWHHLGRNNGVIAWLRHLTYYLFRDSYRVRAGVPNDSSSAIEIAEASGKYYRELKEIRSSAISYDRKAAGQLWQLSLELTRLDRSPGDLVPDIWRSQ